MKIMAVLNYLHTHTNDTIFVLVLNMACLKANYK